MRHFDEELEELKSKLLEMSGLVESAISTSVTALTSLDRQLCERVFEYEDRINIMEIEIDDMATRLLALQQPMASDLRFLTSAIKINNDLERMGDLAVKIAKRALDLMDLPPVKPLVDIPEMARLAESMLHKCLDSFVRRDSALAREVLVSDDGVDDTRVEIFRVLIRHAGRTGEYPAICGLDVRGAEPGAYRRPRNQHRRRRALSHRRD